MRTSDRLLHEHALELAASALDFRLAGTEGAELEAHLAACPACGRAAAALRSDTAALRHPAELQPPRRVDAVVAAAIAGHPARSSWRLLVLVAAALLLVALLGVLAAGAVLLRNRPLLVVVPSPSSPVSEVNPSPSITPAPSLGPSIPTGSLVAYVVGEGPTATIHTILPDGTSDRVLAEGDSPAWSPDGLLLAYGCRYAEAIARGADPPGDICAMNADGSNQRVITAGAVFPRWSPDGHDIMFSRSVIDFGDTWVARADGTDARKVGDGAGSWSPDGARILLLGASGATADATIVRSDGTGARKLGICGDAAWNPDGTKLACTGSRDGTGFLHVLSAADGSLGSLYEDDAEISRPAWVSPYQIAFTLRKNGSSPGAGEDHLYLLDFREGGALQLMDQAVASGAAVGPDQGWLALTIGADGRSDIYVVSVAGEVRRVTTGGGASAPRWQPRAPTESPAPSAGPTRAPAFSNLQPLGAVHVASDRAGWVSTGTALFRTDDAGRTWTDMRAATPDVPYVALAVDADTLYLASPDQPATIEATHDGGATWTRATINERGVGGSPVLSFRTPDQWFATFRTTDGKELHVYSTLDGGRSWIGPIVSPVPDVGYGRIQGPDGGVLWLSNGRADNEPFDNRLLLSLDGGSTWKERRFPTSAAAPKADLKNVTAAWADGDGRIVLAVTLGDGEQVYTSADDGRTWRFVRAWRSFVSGHVTLDYHVTLLSGTVWVLVAQDGSGSRSTTDGGATWRETAGPSRILLDEVSVASPDRAWAVHPCDRRVSPRLQAAIGPDPYCDAAGVRTVLLATDDGGRTWTRIGG